MLESIHIIERSIMRKMPKCFESKKLSILIAVLVLIVDQLSKFWILSYFGRNYFADFLEITPFFRIVLVMNKGVSFGMLGGLISPILLILFAIIAIIILAFFVKNRPSYYRLPTALIIGGAVGNIFDRCIHGSVVDFLDFHLYSYHWPAFNIADTAIVIGVFLLLFISYLEEKKI